MEMVRSCFKDATVRNPKITTCKLRGNRIKREQTWKSTVNGEREILRIGTWREAELTARGRITGEG